MQLEERWVKGRMSRREFLQRVSIIHHSMSEVRRS